MSGQPVNTPTDVKKFRDAYMATLQLQQDINKKNFDANALYKRTGVVPTQILDYRSTSEKLADIFNLKILVRSKLRQIADAQNAEKIAQDLSNDELVYVSQRIDAIIKDLKPKFKFGILPDIFKSYIHNAMEKEEYDGLVSAGLGAPAGNLALDYSSAISGDDIDNALFGRESNPSESSFGSSQTPSSGSYGSVATSAEADPLAQVSPLYEPRSATPSIGSEETIFTADEAEVIAFFDTFARGGPAREGRTLRAFYDIIKELVDRGIISRLPNDRPLVAFGSIGNKEYLMEIIRRNADRIVESGTLKKGEGLKKRKGRGIAKGVDYAKGIDPLPKYAPLGHYYINQQKLKDDIITCCRADGRNAGEWKARRVSLPLANLIRKLVDKGKPSFDEISALSEEDKHILGEFVRKAKVDLEVPSSTISREDLNKFEIMKGQILSGQDNKDYIKEFKLLIVKLCHQGRLPKGQGKEVLMMLAELGY